MFSNDRQRRACFANISRFAKCSHSVECDHFARINKFASSNDLDIYDIRKKRMEEMKEEEEKYEMGKNWDTGSNKALISIPEVLKPFREDIPAVHSVSDVITKELTSDLRKPDVEYRKHLNEIESKYIPFEIEHRNEVERINDFKNEIGLANAKMRHDILEEKLRAERLKNYARAHMAASGDLRGAAGYRRKPPQGYPNINITP
jgi:hypothetical protein